MIESRYKLACKIPKIVDASKKAYLMSSLASWSKARVDM
jgi:hypothetical protein